MRNSRRTRAERLGNLPADWHSAHVMLTSISAARTLADLHGFEAISNMLEDAWNAALAEQTKIMQRESATEKARLKAA